MKVLHLISRLRGHAIHAIDGDIGKIVDFYFDDRSWKIRYMVVDIGRWLPGRKVLLAPQVIGKPDWIHSIIPVMVTREQVRQSPDIDTDVPIERVNEARLYHHYGWETDWASEGMVTGAAQVNQWINIPEMVGEVGKREFDEHLRSASFLNGTVLYGLVDPVGSIHDFALDDVSWSIPFVVVTVEHGKSIIIPSRIIKDFYVEESTGRIDSSYSLLAVRNSPEFDDAGPTILCVEQKEELEQLYPQSLGRP
jgi:hypothetical protein